MRVVGHAIEFFPDKKDRYVLDFEGPVSVAGLVERLGVSRALVMAAIIDGKRQDFDHDLADGAEVVLMTPPAGG